jgi:hypothetical protein
MPTYNLPALQYDPMPAPREFGRWEFATDLRGLSKSLSVANTTAAIDEIKSIPDAWAQAQLCGQALLDSSHELHPAIVGQWRGLLALFALQPLYSDHYDLEILPLDLGDHGDGQRRFRRVLFDLLPSVTLAPGVDWQDVGIILLRDKSGGAFSRGDLTPIGQLSPWTLVSPGKLAAHTRLANIPWLAGGLSDPTSARGLSSDQYAALANYLSRLSEALEAAGARRHDQDLFSEIRSLLGAFYQDCVDRTVDPAELRDQPLHLRWPSPFYEMLGVASTINEAKIPDGDSRTRLSTRPVMDELFPGGVILIDGELERTFHRPPESIRVWERLSLRDAESPAALAKIKSEATSKGFLIVEPADFFTTKLIKFTAGVDIPGNPQTFRSALLPLSPLALMLLDRDALVSAVALEDRGGKHVVTLTLPLADDRHRGRVTQHVLVKTYEDNDVQVEDRPDDLAMWPNFQSPDWPWTFLHYQYDPEFELQTRFGLSAEFIRADVRTHARSSADRVEKIREWFSPDTLAPDRRISADRISELKDEDDRLLLLRLRFADTPRLIGEMHRLPRGVEAIFFARRDDGPRSERPVGCVLIRPAPSVGGQPGNTVSIDFGTTNTIAYIKRGNGLEPVHFRDRLLFPIRMTQNEAEQRERLVGAYADFFPLREYETPIPTVEKVRGFPGSRPPGLKSIAQGGHDAQAFTDTVFFVPDYDKHEGAASILEWIAAEQLVFGIKWAKEEYKRRLTKRFLRQIMMMTAAEAVVGGVSPREINWKFSYPQAFSRQERDSLQHFVRQAWEDLFSDRGAANDAAPPVSLTTEGAAAIRYFTADTEQSQTGAGALMLMLDIGGGTTDIALAYEGKVHWRNSFKIAGGDFFTRYLANNFNILRRIDFNEVASFVESGAGDDPVAVANFVELFVNAPNFTKNFQKSYPAFEAEDEGMGLRQCASVALGGILHYVGLVVGRLLAEKRFKPQALESLTIAFGGRGSTLFRQFDRGERYETDLARLCGLLIAAADPERDPTDIKITTLFSKQPKHEVARGLLIDDDAKPERDELWPAAPLGETIEIKLRDGEPTLGVDHSLEELLDAQGTGNVGLDGLKAFLSNLKRQSGIAIDLDGRNGEGARIIQRAASQAIRTAFRSITKEDEQNTDTQTIEPPFITTLRGLVEIMNRPVADRNTRIIVKDAAQ